MSVESISGCGSLLHWGWGRHLLVHQALLLEDAV